MEFVKATVAFEQWLEEQLEVLVAQDLQQKHLNMTRDPLVHLRATYYRWAQMWPLLCEADAQAPEVLAVADLHVENFGTWRDAEGRLSWGVNDVDEAFVLPYTSDLTRLATSAALQLKINSLKLNVGQICDAITAGYQKGLDNGPRPFVLAETHAKLRKMALGELRNPVLYWSRMQALPKARHVPDDAAESLKRAMPSGIKLSFHTRQAGEGSLGRQRFVALANFEGGLIAREVKAFAPSAIIWALNKKMRFYYEQMLQSPHRVRDPYLHLEGRWIVRRLAPDCSRIDLAALSAMSDQNVLLKAMGRETCNIHLGTPKALKSIQADLGRRRKHWLPEAVEKMVDQIEQDLRSWRKEMAKSKGKKR